MDTPSPSQSGKPKQAACDNDCDKDEGRSDERLRKIAMRKPVPEKP